MLNRRAWLAWSCGTATGLSGGLARANPGAVPGTAVPAELGFEVSPWPSRQPVPALALPDLQGKTWTLPDLLGRVVVLNFWATWCAPCRSEMPTLRDMASVYDPDELLVLAVNVAEGPRRVAQFVQANGLSELTVLMDPRGETARAWDAARVLPTTILIDAQGRARQRVRGEVDWTGRSAAALLEPLLRAGKPQRASGNSTQRSNAQASVMLVSQ